LQWLGGVEDIDASNDEDYNCDAISKPRIRINTVLKTVLMTLYPMEMRLCNQAELQKQKRAISGEAGGCHTPGSHVEIVPLLDEGTHELDFLCHSSTTSLVTGTTINDGCVDEEYGWSALYPLSSRTGWSSSSSNKRRDEGGKGGGGLYYNTHGSGPRVMIRRNIVLDENDQRYQLSLGLTKCTYHPDVMANGDTNVQLVKLSSPSNIATASSIPDNTSYSIGAGVATIGGILDIELCLQSMEEDEVDDNAGFPIVINDGHDDESLICANDSCVHTCIESIARVVLTTTATTTPMSINGAMSSPRMLLVHEVPLSRGMIGRDGTVRFRIDMKSVMVRCAMSKKLKAGIDDVEGDDDSVDSDDDECGKFPNKESQNNAVCRANNNMQVIKLIFHHVDSGAKLELRLPSTSAIHEITRNSDHCGEGIDFCGLKKPGDNNGCGECNGNNAASRYLLDDPDDDDNDDDNENEYDLNDGFLVNGSQDSVKSDNTDEFDSDDADDGECQICNKGGDLIVCDGGDHQDGCGDSYHVLCIGRTVVPPGDWICMACSKDVGLVDVGIEGHEYADANIDSTLSKKADPLVIGDGDSDDESSYDDVEIIPSWKTKRIVRKILHTPDSDSE
jgi:hypothetical protein